MECYMHNEEEEIIVKVKEIQAAIPNQHVRTFWVVAIERGDDGFKMFCKDKTDIQVLIDLLKTEALKIGAYVI